MASAENIDGPVDMLKSAGDLSGVIKDFDGQLAESDP